MFRGMKVRNEGNSYLHYFLFACEEVVVGEIDGVRTSHDGQGLR